MYAHRLYTNCCRILCHGFLARIAKAVNLQIHFEEQLGKRGTFEVKTMPLSFAVRILLETEVEDNLDFLLDPI